MALSITETSCSINYKFENSRKDEIFISVETVKRHMATIFEKLGIESRREMQVLQA